MSDSDTSVRVTAESAAATSDVVTRLQNFLAVTDPWLIRLGVDRLQNEVLGRLREILDADTAAVLLRERDSDYLVARAAKGVEEEVRQGVRIPIGTGFAGQIAEARRPLRLRHVDASTVANPLLWEKGVCRMLGVPLLSGGQVLGVLHIGRLEPRDFTDDDETLLQLAAERIAAAVERSRHADEAAAADVLERDLLPSRLPRIAGLQVASRYVPAENRSIGGDWYDVFLGPDGALWVVTGDVAGHGLRAAVVMGRVKSALRAYTLLGEGPARVLELTDRKIVHFEMGAMITTVCARSYPPFDTWSISSAGHLPPVVATPDGAAVLSAIPPGPPLGAQPHRARIEVDVDLASDGLLLLYTDGLVERRGEVLDAGLDRLCAVVTADHPDLVCRAVMHELVGSDSPADDIALLAVRRTG